jgi:hypothetical protein
VVVTCDDGKDYDLKVDDLIGGKWKHQPKEKAVYLYLYIFSRTRAVADLI